MPEPAHGAGAQSGPQPCPAPGPGRSARLLVCGLFWSLLSSSLWAQSAQRGQTLFETRCVACHSLATNRVGPALGGVLGRQVGRAPGYAYSAALAGASHTWDAARLNAWLSDPQALLPGQAMNYRVEQAADREDIVAYLATAR